MSGIKKEINNLLKIAEKIVKTTQDEISFGEYEFQEKIQYKKFKAKQNIPRKEIERFTLGIERFNFHAELVYWNKILVERHVHKKEDKCRIYLEIIDHL